MWGETEALRRQPREGNPTKLSYESLGQLGNKLA